MSLSHERLLEVLEYDFLTGDFYWKTNKSPTVKKGDRAGTLHHTGYVNIFIDNKSYRAHRLVWFYVNKKWPNIIDHLNHTKNDNRVENLRDVDSRNNQHNRRLKNLVGHTCLHFTKSGKYEVIIDLENKRFRSKSFLDLNEAIKKRDEMFLKLNIEVTNG